MQVFAANVTQVAERFLHAGYVSAYPRTFSMMPSGDPKLQLDVTEALKLKGETLAGAGLLGDGGVAAAIASGGSWGQVLLAAAMVCATVMAWILLRDRLSAAARRWVPVAIPFAAVLGFAACDQLPTTPPWQGQAVKEYADPQQATVALLNGIVADGIINMGREIECLANIQDEVGLPKTDLSEGEAYALMAYGLDGWGKEMRLAKDKGSTDEGPSYTVTSAGADGAFDSADDLSITVRQADDYSWDNLRWGYFLKDSQPTLLIHRWTGGNFLFADSDKAQSLTGGRKFDVVAQSTLESRDLSEALSEKYEQAATGAAHKPLLLLVY